MLYIILFLILVDELKSFQYASSLTSHGSETLVWMISVFAILLTQIGFVAFEGFT